MTLKKKIDCQKRNASYYKSQCTQFKKTLKEKTLDLSFHENLTCEQKEVIDSIDTKYIQTFQNGHYTTKVCIVFYGMLKCNVAVSKWELLEIILKKFAGCELQKISSKTLIAEMLAEMEIVSKSQVHEVLTQGDSNILHMDGTKYNFEEIGSFQVSTESGS